MRQLLIVSLTLLTAFSCSDKKEKDDEKSSDSELSSPELSDSKFSDIKFSDSEFKVDSLFVETYKADGLNEIEKPKNFVVSEDEEIYKQAGESAMTFFEYKSKKISDTIDLKLVLTTVDSRYMPQSMLRVVCLATVGKSGQQIDHVRVGKIEHAADLFVLETSVIKNDSVTRTTDKSFLDYDSLKGDFRVYQPRTDIFLIKKDGKIERK